MAHKRSGHKIPQLKYLDLPTITIELFENVVDSASWLLGQHGIVHRIVEVEQPAGDEVGPHGVPTTPEGADRYEPRVGDRVKTATSDAVYTIAELAKPDDHWGDLWVRWPSGLGDSTHSGPLALSEITEIVYKAQPAYGLPDIDPIDIPTEKEYAQMDKDHEPERIAQNEPTEFKPDWDMNKVMGQERAKLTTDLIAEASSDLRGVIAGVRDARSDFTDALTHEEVSDQHRLAELELYLVAGLEKMREFVTSARHAQAAIDLRAEHEGKTHAFAAAYEHRAAEAAHDAIRAEAL